MPEVNRKLQYTFSINSFEVMAEYFDKDINNIFLPLIEKLCEMQKAKNARLIVFLAAPPATGKTTLSMFLSYLSGISEGATVIQALGLDGFHYPHSYISGNTVSVNGKIIPMIDIKGSPETFDLCKAKNRIELLQKEDVMWPVYDRTVHDVKEDGLCVKEKIVLIEGNWLLLDEPGWRELVKLCDYSIFIHAEEAFLLQRLVNRKIAGGKSHDEAMRFCERSDIPNVRRVLKNRLDSDITLKLQENGEFWRVDDGKEL